MYYDYWLCTMITTVWLLMIVQLQHYLIIGKKNLHKDKITFCKPFVTQLSELLVCKNSVKRRWGPPKYKYRNLYTQVTF